MSEALGETVKLRITVDALRSVEHRGGLDPFLLKARTSELSMKAQRIKRRLQKKLADAESTAG